MDEVANGYHENRDVMLMLNKHDVTMLKGYGCHFMGIIFGAVHKFIMYLPTNSFYTVFWNTIENYHGCNLKEKVINIIITKNILLYISITKIEVYPLNLLHTYLPLCAIMNFFFSLKVISLLLVVDCLYWITSCNLQLQCP